MTSMTEREWDKLGTYETTRLRDAINAVDEVRRVFRDPDEGGPPEIRMQLENVYALAMRVINEDDLEDAAAMFDRSDTLSMMLFDVTQALKRIESAVEDLNALRAEDFESPFEDEEP
jgi:chromosome segregation ATPase